MAIITVSRQWYSLGDEIAARVAENLGYDLIDKQKIGEAFAELGFPAGELERFDEKKPAIWDMLALQKRKFIGLLKAVIFELAEGDRILILGRGAQFLLRDLPGTLRVRIVAPFAVRLKRMMAAEALGEGIAERLLRRRDQEAAGYIRAYFNADWNDPDACDLLINTRTTAAGTASAMIENVIRSAEFFSDPEKRREKLAALALQQKAEAAIMEVQRKTNVYVAVTEVENGIVTLRGTTDSEAMRAQCEQAVADIAGVRGIQNEVVVVKSGYW